VHASAGISRTMFTALRIEGDRGREGSMRSSLHGGERA
jgi:hypothetical protein